MKHYSAPHHPGSDPSYWQQLCFGESLQQQLEPLLPKLCHELRLSGLFSIGELASQLSLPTGLIKERLHMQAADLLPGLQGHEYIPAHEDSLSNLLACQLLDYQTEPEILIRELARPIVPGGHLLLTGWLKYSPLSWTMRPLSPRGWPKYPVGWLDTRSMLIKHELYPVSVHWLAPITSKPVQLLATWAGPLVSVAFLIIARKEVMPMTPMKLRLNPTLPIFGPRLQPDAWCEGKKHD